MIRLIAILIIAFTFAYFIIQAIQPIMEKQCISMENPLQPKFQMQKLQK